MKLGGKINFAVAKISLVALLGAGAACMTVCKINRDLEGVSSYTKNIDRYEGMKKASAELLDTEKKESYLFGDNAFLHLPENATEAFGESFHTREYRWDKVRKARLLTDREIRRVEKTHEYECARAERDDIDETIDSLKDARLYLTILGGVGLLSSAVIGIGRILK